MTYHGHWKVWSFGKCLGEFRTIPEAEFFCLQEFGKDWDDYDNCKAIISKGIVV